MADKNKLQLNSLIKSVLLSIILSLIFILIITFICYWGNISEKVLGFMLFLASAVSVFIGSIFLAKKVGRAGLVYGFLNGLTYFLLILLVSVCVSGNFSPSSQVFTTLAGALLSGALGGVIGVNH